VLLAWASARRGIGRSVAPALLAVLAALSLGGQIYFHKQYSIYLNLDASLFGTSLVGSMFGYLRADGANFALSVLPPVLAALALVWLGRRLVRPRRVTSRVLGMVALPVLAAAFFIPCSYRSVQGSTPDVIYFHAMGGLLKQMSGTPSPSQLRPGRRSPPALPRLRPSPPSPRNVLFVMLEGVRYDAGCTVPGEACTTLPETDGATPTRLPLRQLRSDSSTTAVQLAVLWSGLPTNATRDAFHRAPLLFDFAAAAGLESAYWTSHHPLFANSRLWTQDLPTRFQCSATQLDPLADVDLGADDRLLTDRVKQELPQLREPFLAVVQFGNTHMPFLIDPEDAPFAPHKSSRAPDDNQAFHNEYKNAIHRQDKLVGELLRFVRAARFGERTVVVLTSDHGEAFREHGQLGHTGSVFDVEVHVPGWIDAPKGTLSTAERSALQGRADEPAFHSDLTPTILDLLGLWDEPAIAPYRQAMVGASLLRAGGAERLVVMSNCTGVWGCAFENWGLMQGRRKLLAREWDRSWLCYDLEADPEEARPLGPEACGDLAAQAQRIYGRLPGRP
jgi:glucan phosphoethanolaminetransferase (alkaline phosphatase superfamily)